MYDKPRYDPQKHHRRSIRFQEYDYSQEGLYFITICTKNRQHLFGTIENGEMLLNAYGRIADDCYREITSHYPGCILHDHVIMPNHVHGILELTEENVSPDVRAVRAQNFEPLQSHPLQNKYQKIIPRSIGAIIRGYKTGVTKWFRNNTDIEDVWQRNYYEHIIRNEKSYQTISDYIMNNPANWEDDKFYNDGKI